MAFWRKCHSPKCIVDKVNGGHGIIPFFGSGASSPAGIPILKELQEYLCRCIALSLGLAGSKSRRWNPRTDRWPEVIHESGEFGIDWRQLVSAAIQRRTGWQQRVFQEAYGAMAEWRSSLLFLSRIVQNADGDLELVAPEDEVVDTFFIHFTSRKRPAIVHRLLSLLVGPVNIPLILTTNFDELIEMAFEETGQRIVPFDIHNDRSLPPLRVLRDDLALLKLHGGRFGLRADYSLDSTVTDEDKRNFVSYFHGGTIDETEWGFPTKHPKRRPLSVKNDLMVVGFSGADGRIQQLLETCLYRLDKDFEIFWICYNENDVQNVIRFADGCAEKFPWLRNNEQIKIIPHQDPNLLMLEIAQMSTRNLPRRQSVFPSTAQICLPPKFEPIDDAFDREKVAEFGKKISAKIDQAVQSRKSRLVGVTSERTRNKNGKWKRCHGITRGMQIAFKQQVDRGRYCIWLDLDDVTSSDDLYEQLLHAMAKRVGIEDWPAVILNSDPTSQAKEVSRIASGLGRQWVIFINGREGAGTNMFDFNGNPSGWLACDPSDDYEDSELLDPTRNPSALIAFFSEITSEICPSVTVVFSYRDDPANENPLTRHLKSSGLGRFQAEPLRENLMQKKLKDARTRIMEQFPVGSPHRTLLIYILLFRRTRYLVSIVSKAKELYGCEFEDTNSIEVLRLLVEEHLIREKPGGFYWFHVPIRNQLRKALRLDLADCEDKAYQLELTGLERKIADWYVPAISFFQRSIGLLRGRHSLLPSGDSNQQRDRCRDTGRR